MKGSIVVLLLGVGALAGSGCGGSDSVSAEAAGLTVTAPSSEMEFGRRVEAICRQVITASARDQKASTTPEKAAEQIDNLIAYQGAAVEVLRELDAPEDAQAQVAALADSIEQQRGLIRRSFALLQELGESVDAATEQEIRELQQQVADAQRRLQAAASALDAPTCAFSPTG